MKLKNLKEELETYGYKFSVTKSLMWAILIGGLVVVLGVIFGLPTMYMIILACGLAFISPFYISCILKISFEEKKFSEINIYIEQFLYSFQKTGKILSSLRDVRQLFEEGDMHDNLDKAIDHIENDFDEEDSVSASLRELENVYPTNLLCTAHKFCQQVEVNGGESQMGISLLLEARRLWADRTTELMKMKRQKVVQIIFSVVLSVMMCWVLLTVGKRINIDICEYTIARVSMVLMIWLNLLIIYKACKKMAVSLCESRLPGEEVLEKYKVLCKHRMKKGIHPFDNLRFREVKKAIEQVYPQWLLQVSILLQCENVQVALSKSYDDAPLLMKPFLKDFLQELNESPTNIVPYINFLQEFNLPQVQSSMKMLYSISEGNGGQASVQIEDIIRRNQLMIDQSEKMKNSDEMAGMYALFLAPQITSGMKMLIDMAVMFFGLMSSGMVMGG